MAQDPGEGEHLPGRALVLADGVGVWKRACRHFDFGSVTSIWLWTPFSHLTPSHRCPRQLNTAGMMRFQRLASSGSSLLARQPLQVWQPVRTFGAKRTVVKPPRGIVQELHSLRGSYKGPNVLDISMLTVFKDEPIQTKPDSEYPDWIWSLNKPLPNLNLLKAADYQTLDAAQRLRLARLERRAKIKAENARRKNHI